jgi:hypothetical protein
MRWGAGADLIEAGLNEGAGRMGGALWALFIPGGGRYDLACGFGAASLAGTAGDRRR